MCQALVKCNIFRAHLWYKILQYIQNMWTTTKGLIHGDADAPLIAQESQYDIYYVHIHRKFEEMRIMNILTSIKLKRIYA